MTFSTGHILLTAVTVTVLTAAIGWWRLPRRARVEAVIVALLAGAAVFLWRISANQPQLNDDGLPGFSANDWAAPILTYITLAVYADLRPLPTRHATARFKPSPSSSPWPSMSSPSDHSPTRRPRPRIRTVVVVAGVILLAATIAIAVALRYPRQPSRASLPLHAVATIQLPGDTSRFDYASLDPQQGLLFIAHLGASQIIEVDIHAGRVVRTIDDLPGVHGVLVVPDLHRVYATATNSNQMVILDEDTGTALAHGPTGDYPDGLAYDPQHHTIWTTNETGGSETILDATTADVLGTVPLGGEAGNVYYNPATATMLVDVQSRNQLAVIDTTSHTITRRVSLPGCDHDHGLSIDPTNRLAFIACDANATLLTVDLNTWQVLDNHPVGQDPDVLAYDSDAHRLYVAAESGWLTTLDLHNHQLQITGSDHLANGAHVVAVDPTNHRSYYPIPSGPDGHPALLAFDPTH